MARFIGVLVIIAALIAGVGYYRGWFTVGSESADGKTHINMTVDKDKVKSDVNAVQQKATDTFKRD
jgi:hypothetical protein